MLKLTNRKILLLGIILAIFRLTNLTNFPIFGDEALYLSLSDNILKSPQTHLNSIQYGVMPIYIWIQSLFFLINQNTINLLLLGRILNVLFDLTSGFLVFLITKKLFDQKSATLALIIYLILPINFLHSRMVLLESTTNLFILSSIYLYLKFINEVQNNGRKLQTLTSISLLAVLSYFTKPISIINYPTLFSIPLLVIFNKKHFTIKSIQPFAVNWLIIFCLTGILITIFYLPISHEFTRFIGNNTFLLTSMKKNIWKVIWWSQTYFTLPFIIISLIASLYGLFKKNCSILWLTFWTASALFLSVITAANFYPRHLYLLAAPVAIIVGLLLANIFKYNITRGLLITLIVIFPSLSLNIQIVTNPLKAPIALEDRQQYFEDWSSGQSIDQVAEYLTLVSRNKTITVFVEDESSQYWVLTKLYKVPKAKIVPSKNLFAGQYLEEELKSQATDHSYIVLNKNPYPPTDWPIQKVTSFPKGPNREISIFKIQR